MFRVLIIEKNNNCLNKKKRGGVLLETPPRICLNANMFKFPYLQSSCTYGQWNIR